MMQPLVSIFIPTCNRAASIKKVLDSLAQQTYKHFEVIIVDYKSTDSTLKIIDSFKKVLMIKLIRQKKKGLSRAANEALKIAEGEIFIRTDDDVIMSPKWLEAIVETFKGDDTIGGVTGPTVVPKNHLTSRDLLFFTEKFRQGNLLWKFIGKIYFNYLLERNPYRVSNWCKSGAFSLGSNYESSLNEPIREVNNLEACNFSVRTKLLKKIEGFDLNYVDLGEYHEPDAAFKIMNLGYRLIFNPKASLNHCPSQDGFYKDRPNSYTRMTNFIKFYFSHIKPNTFDKFLRFSSYLLFLNSFYIFQFLKKRQINQLGAIQGTFVGLLKELI